MTTQKHPKVAIKCRRIKLLIFTIRLTTKNLKLLCRETQQLTFSQESKYGVFWRTFVYVFSGFLI